MQAKMWKKTIWIPHSGLPKHGKVRYCFWYHKTAVGHAIGDSVKSEFQWQGDNAAYLVKNSLFQGACMIDPIAVVTLGCFEKDD